MTMPAQTPEPAPAASARRLFGARYGEGLAVLLPEGGRNRREIVRHEGRCAEGTSGG